MPGQTSEKKVAAQSDLAQKLSEQLRKLQEESALREKQIASALDARYTEELKKLQAERAAKEREFAIDLDARHAEGLKKLQEESVAREKQILSDFEARHNQALAKLKEENAQREIALLDKWRKDHEGRFKDLFSALISARSGRDRIILAVSWIAIGILVVMSFTGYVYGNVSAVLVIGVLAGFAGAIIFAGKNNKWNKENLQFTLKDEYHQNLKLDNDYRRAVQFFFLGLLSFAFLNLAVFLNPLGKADIGQQSTISSDQSTATSGQAATSLQGALPLGQSMQAPVPSVPLSPVEIPRAGKKTGEGRAMNSSQNLPSSSESSAKIGGNGGNFAGGISKK